MSENVSVRNDNKELIRFLAKIDLFGSLSKLEKKNLIKYMYIRNYKKDEIVFKKGYPNVVFYIVKSGTLKVFLEDNETELEIKQLHTCDFFGEMGLFQEEFRSASIAAIEESKLLAISKRDLNEFIVTFPRAGVKILYKFGQLLSNNIINANKRLSQGSE